jgi:hypothetical protein
MGLEDTLNDLLRQLGDTMAFDPAAQEVKAPQPVNKDGASYDPIRQAQTIEARCKAHAAMELLRWPMLHQSSLDSCSEGAKERTEGMETMQVDGTNYQQPDALIPGHPAVTKFLRSQGRTMNYKGTFNNVKQGKSFCREYFNGLDLQGSIIPRNTTVLLQPGEAGQRMHTLERLRQFHNFSGPSHRCMNSRVRRC